MLKNLVIVESPAKAKTLQRFLGDDYKVMSSYGHIRDLRKKEFSIDLDTFSPEYEIPSDKASLVKELKSKAKDAQVIWLASDEDREGEAISWHLCEVLGLDPSTTKRIVFHEITKNAILEAVKHPRSIDQNLVNAQQARRVLDRIVGFKLSPILWKKVKPSLSAGRVQSVAVRLIVEKEREIQQFQQESSYRVQANFIPQNVDGKNNILKADLSKRFPTQQEADEFLRSCVNAEFKVDDIQEKPIVRSPAPPFTTSTLQQEAARKLGYTVSQTMMIAQKLYEEGLITYMRTDSVNLSTLCLGACKEEITNMMGAKYVKTRQFHTNTKGAQEAHEAIRPTYISNHEIEGTSREKRLYELIWKRTVASQMADAQVEKTTIDISVSQHQEKFVATGETILFDGFLRVYKESNDDDNTVEAADAASVHILPPVAKGDVLGYDDITATERFSQHPPRYTEASLVKKLEELGIGRPSTYAPTISTIQQRDYVEKGDRPGTEHDVTTMTLKGGKVTMKTKKEVIGAEKNKLIPTDVGVVVNDFLLKCFPDIMDYHFTAHVEKDFDEIAEGKEEWKKVIKTFYNHFEPMVEKTLSLKEEHKVGERELGKDPASGKSVFVKIGRFGPVVQIGSASDEEKPLFAQLKKEQSIESITLEEALELFKLPRALGEYEGEEVTVGASRFGPYVKHGKTYVSIPKTQDPLNITLEECLDLIKQKASAEQKKHLKKFDEEPELEIMNGRFGPYIAYKGANYRIAKSVANPSELTLQQCLDIVNKAADKTSKPSGKRTTKA